MSRFDYVCRQEIKDLEIKKRILELREFHKNYGYRRLAIALNLNKKRVRRICKKYQIQIHRKASNPFKVSSQELNKYPNLLKNLSPLTENIVWATDFTYLKYKDKFFYLATFIDIYTRKIVGFSISDKHDTDLILKAFYDAIHKENRSPAIIHSDQGTEYCSDKYFQALSKLNIKISMSAKASPWQNGFQESFYRGFKEDLGSLKYCNSIGELFEKVFQTIHYYNNLRIHLALKMSPIQFSNLISKSGTAGS